MECRQFKFTSHAIQRMFERAIGRDTVISVVQNGEVIAEYTEDEPYPSYLFFSYVNKRPVHVLSALDIETKICYIITVYEPDIEIWSEDFKTRRSQ